MCVPAEMKQNIVFYIPLLRPLLQYLCPVLVEFDLTSCCVLSPGCVSVLAERLC